jgi:hypothetical protein
VHPDLPSLFTWEFWVSVGIGTVVLHLVSMYAHNALGRVGGSLWGKLSARSRAVKEAHEALVVEIIENPEERFALLAQEMRFRFSMLLRMICSGFMFFMAITLYFVAPGDEGGRWIFRVFALISVVFVGMALFSLEMAERCERALKQARRLLEAARNEIP